MIYKYAAEGRILQLLVLKTHRKQPNNSSACLSLFLYRQKGMCCPVKVPL